MAETSGRIISDKTAAAADDEQRHVGDTMELTTLESSRLNLSTVDIEMNRFTIEYA